MIRISGAGGATGAQAVERKLQHRSSSKVAARVTANSLQVLGEIVHPLLLRGGDILQRGQLGHAGARQLDGGGGIGPGPALGIGALILGAGGARLGRLHAQIGELAVERGAAGDEQGKGEAREQAPPVCQRPGDCGRHPPAAIMARQRAMEMM